MSMLHLLQMGVQPRSLNKSVISRASGNLPRAFYYTNRRAAHNSVAALRWAEGQMNDQLYVFKFMP